MRRRVTAISLIELALIISLSGLGTYAFVNSNIYRLLQDGIAPEYSYFAYFMPLILWGLLIFGLFTITIKGMGSGSFMILIALFSLPSTLAYNSVNWFAIFGLEFGFTTNLSFYEMLGLAALIVTGYVALNQIRSFKQLQQNLLDGGADPDETEAIVYRSHLMLLSVAAIALALVASVALLSRNLEFLALRHIGRLPWYAVLIGLSSALLLAAYLFWLGTRRKAKVE